MISRRPDGGPAVDDQNDDEKGDIKVPKGFKIEAVARNLAAPTMVRL